MMTVSADDSDHASHKVSMPEVLNTLGHETRILADGLNDLQTVIGDLLGSGANVSSQSLYELQSIDRLAQSLDAISECLSGLSKQSPEHWTIDVAQVSRSVKLAEIRDRLHGGGTSDDASGHGSGDYEDFSLTG